MFNVEIVLVLDIDLDLDLDLELDNSNKVPNHISNIYKPKGLKVAKEDQRSIGLIVNRLLNGQSESLH